MLKITHCLDNRLRDGGNVVSPTHRPLSTPQKHDFSASGTHFCWRLGEPQGLVRPEGLDKLKKMHSPHRVSNLRPSGLWHSALTTTLPRTPLLGPVCRAYNSQGVKLNIHLYLTLNCIPILLYAFMERCIVKHRK
jgi:hypothetical protein